MHYMTTSSPDSDRDPHTNNNKNNAFSVHLMSAVNLRRNLESWLTRDRSREGHSLAQLWLGFFCMSTTNHLILKEINSEYSLEVLMLKLKLQYFGHLMWRTDSFEKTLMLEKIEAGGEGEDRGWEGWMASPTQWTWVSVNSGSWWWTGRPGVLRFMGLQRVGHDRATELNWWQLYLWFFEEPPYCFP